MLGFSQLSKPIKWQDLLEKGKNGLNAFRTGAKVHFSEKTFWGYGHFKKWRLCLEELTLIAISRVHAFARVMQLRKPSEPHYTESNINTHSYMHQFYLT